MLPDWSADELFHEAVVEPRRAFVPLPDTRSIVRPGWSQLITPSLREGGLNEVSLAVLDEGEVDRVIDATIAGYAGRGLRFRWTVAPDSRPADLAIRLASRGLQRSESVAMAGSTLGPSKASVGAYVELVDARTVDEFTRVMGVGWALDPAPLVDLHRRLVAAPELGWSLFLARRGGEAVGVASYCAFPRSAYLIGAVVLPGHRGHGLYRALVEARLSHAAARGLRIATSQARAETSAPILAHLGFVSVCPIASFTNAPAG